MDATGAVLMFPRARVANRPAGVQFDGEMGWQLDRYVNRHGEQDRPPAKKAHDRK
jgi:hypothetical protein